MSCGTHLNKSQLRLLALRDELVVCLADHHEGPIEREACAGAGLVVCWIGGMATGG